MENANSYVMAGLAAGAVLLGHTGMATAASLTTFTGSFSGGFGEFIFIEENNTVEILPPILDFGTVSFTFIGEDLNGDGVGDFRLFSDDDILEFTSLTLESSGFSMPEFNFSLFIDQEFFTDFENSNANAFPGFNIMFDFDNSRLVFVSLFNEVSDNFVIIFADGLPDPDPDPALVAVGIDIDGEQFVIGAPAPAAIPEPLTIVGSVIALSGGAFLRRRRSSEQDA